MTMDSLAFRRAEDSDLPFIVDSWVSSYRTAHAAGMIPMSQYEAVYEDAVRYVLARPGVRVYVAHHPGADTESRANLYGWLACEDNVEVPQRIRIAGRWEERLIPADCVLLHYVYVKNAFRRLGIATGLLSASGIDPGRRFLFTCKTPAVSRSSLFRCGEWQPLVARFPK